MGGGEGVLRNGAWSSGQEAGQAFSTAARQAGREVSDEAGTRARDGGAASRPGTASGSPQQRDEPHIDLLSRATDDICASEPFGE